MRGEKIWPAAVEAITAAPQAKRIDDKGNMIVVGRDSEGRTLEVVLALDDPDFVITVFPRREATMKADYDSEANALSIDLIEVLHWEGSEGVGERVNVAFANGRPANVELLYPDLGLEKPLRAAAERFELDAEALIAAAQAAIAAPDREVTLDLAGRRAA